VARAGGIRCISACGIARRNDRASGTEGTILSRPEARIRVGTRISQSRAEIGVLSSPVPVFAVGVKIDLADHITVVRETCGVDPSRGGVVSRGSP